MRSILCTAALLVGCDLSSPGIVHPKDGGPDAAGSESTTGGSVGAGGHAAAGTGGVAGSGGSVAGGAAGSGAGAGGSSAGNGGTTAPSTDGGDAGPGGESDGGDAAPPCTAGLPCTDLGECVHGLTSCKNGVSSCAKSENAEDGTTCTGGVCSGGACTACDAGKDCSDATSCEKKKIVCTSGKPVCTASGNKLDGDSCGTNLYCNQGACKPCTPGSSCTPTSNPCHKGTASCIGGAIACNDTGMAADPGTACGTNQVCKGGSCVTCAADVSCPPSNPCHKGITSCSTGSSVCMDQGPRTDSPPCDDGNACTQTDLCQSGTCTGSNAVVCTASDVCHNAGSCDKTTGVCSNPNAADGKGCNDGNACTKTDTCKSGVCTGSNAVVCTASDACHLVGMCDQSNGTCSNPISGPVSCGTNKVCQSGSCVCSGSTTACGSACLDLTNDKNNCGACGKSCGPGSCSGGKCQSFTVTTLGSTSDCYGLATDGPHVVWLNYDSTQSTVLELPAAGGTPTQLSQAALPGPTAAQIAMANGTVAWPVASPIYAWSGVEGAANSGARGPLLTTSTAASTGMGINPSGGVVYITIFDAITPSNIALWSCPLGLTTCTKRTMIGGISTGVAVSASNVFWTEAASGNVQRYALSDSSVSSVATGQGSPAALVLDATYAYWVNRISASSFSIARVLQSTSSPSSDPVLSTTAGAANAIATDGTFVYYAGLSGSTNVGYVPVAGGAAKTLSTGGTVNRGAMASAGGYIYWYDSSDKKIRGIATPIN